MKAFRFAFALFLVFSLPTLAEDFPSRPVRIVVPYTPSTGADILSRLLGPKLGERWKVAVVTENKPGATGNIGAEFVAKSPPDGYTLLFVATSFGTTPALQKSLPYDPVKSFEPVALIATSGLVVVVNPQVPARSMKELIDLAKREPGKLHYSSPGNGGPQHLAMELVKLETGMNIVHVPYKAAAGALTDVVGGHVDATVAAVQTAHPQVQAGKLRALAVTTPKRVAAAPEVPTMIEAGLPNFEIVLYSGILGPRGMDRALVRRLNAEFAKAVESPEMKQVWQNLGADPIVMTPEAFEAATTREIAKLGPVVKGSGAKLE